jgi:hypothetical protein
MRAGSREELRRTIDALDGAEAKRVIAALVAARPALLPDVASLASRTLGAVDVEKTARRVAQALGRLGIEDVWDRPGQFSGRTYDDDDGTGAYRLVEERIEPFVRDLERRVRLGRDAEALALCKGTLLGLYRVDQEQGDGFLDGYAPDVLSDMAAWVAQTWRKRGGRARPRRAQDRIALRGFAADALSDWERSLTRIIGKEPRGHRNA